MSKIFLIGDIHFALGYPNNHQKWQKIHQEYFSKFLIPTLKKLVSSGDIIVQLGDLFDNRNIIPIDSLNYALDIVEELSNIAPTHILVGNHDCWHKSHSEINTIRPFKWMPNVYVYDSVTKIDIDGIKILMMPYIDKKEDQIRYINENKDCHYLFCHSDLNGAKMHLTSVAHKNMDKIGVDEFNNFNKVYSGHIHINQSEKNFTFVGNIFQMDRNDMNNNKGIMCLDLKNNTEEFIKNYVSPIFRKVYLKTEEDIKSLDELTDTKDYIDLFISNSLLIGNRKIRRKLEIILEKSGFASIEYIDDINISESINESVEEIKIIDENGEPVSIKLEYKDIIHKYILDQKYESEKIKCGILNEFNEIIKIYDENFKNKD